MAYTDILYGVDNLIATITLNRPDKLNAWTSEMDREVRHAVEAAAADGNVRAIVLTGAGRGFCAGADMGRLSDASSGNTSAAPPVIPPESDDDLAQRYSYLLAVPKPIIAGINGAIAGVGLCIALYCDLAARAVIDGLGQGQTAAGVDLGEAEVVIEAGAAPLQAEPATA